MKTPELRSRAG